MATKYRNPAGESSIEWIFAMSGAVTRETIQEGIGLLEYEQEVRGVDNKLAILDLTDLLTKVTR